MTSATTQKTTVDWLRFRHQGQPSDTVAAMQPLFGTVSHLLHLGEFERGKDGFQLGARLMLADMPIARLDWGGASQRGWVRVDMPGKGCEWVSDWDAIRSVEDLPSAQPRRLDLALTTWSNEVTYEQVIDAHGRGRFTTRGRTPELRELLSSDPRAGRTAYVGQRKSDKFLRAYEKGFQLEKAYPEHMRGAGFCVSGYPSEGIFRNEVEFKAAERPIPWECIDRRDEYFAGAYPWCADILPGVDADILQRRPERAPQTDLAVALANCRTQWGATIFTALHAYHGDMGAVFEKLCGKEHNKALVEAGVLLVDHE